MSSLILPPTQQNVVLENNLKAFFQRYPYEKARLESILRKPAKTYPLAKIEVPAAPSKPPIRVLLLCGIVNPQFLATLLNDPIVRKENFKTFIIENDPEFLAFCFQHADLTQIIMYEKTEWFLCHNKDSIKPAFFRAMKPEGVSALMLNVQVLEIAAPQTQEAADFYDYVPAAYNETCHHVLHNHGNLDDSLLGIEVTLKNKDWILNSPGILDLKDHYKGCSALIVGAGPSLDSNLETIKKYNDRYVVIAVDAALKPLMAAGIRVDYVTSIERLNAYQVPFFDKLENVEADLVAYPVLHPDVLAMYPGQVRICYRNYGFYAYFEKAYPKGIIKSGGSTAHLAVRLADYIGCRRAFMIGLDSCYEEKNGKYRSHCQGTGHPNWGEFVELEEFAKSRRHLPPMKALNNLGQETMTNVTYYQWVKEYAEELSYIGQRMGITNCNATGIAIPGIPFKPLEEAVSNLDPNLPEKPTAPPVTFNRNWSNKDLRKNFQSWLTAAEVSIKEADELLAMETLNFDRYQALLYVFNFRFCVDDLFVAFVIQCCAFKFFELENHWWSLNIDADKDLKEKTEVIKARFQLFKTTLERLIKMLEEEGDANE